MSEHVTEQLPSHLMSQLEVSRHATELPSSRLILQLAPFLHVASEFVPAFSSHFVDPSQSISLLGPPLPLHSASGEQLMVTDAVESAIHFVSVSQVSVHAAVSQLAWQSSPELHVHELDVHVHPAPEQSVPAEDPLPPPPPQATTPTIVASIQLPKILARNVVIDVPFARSRSSV